MLPHRLGAHLVDGGLDVVVFASHAEALDLCLLDVGPGGAPSERRFRLRRGAAGLWHGHVPGVGPGQHYGLRAHGRWDPSAGLLHNPAKLLLDPYARGIAGTVDLEGPVYPYRRTADGAATGAPDDSDSAGHVPHGVVVDDPFPAADNRPRTPWERTVLYEAHVRGLTMQLPGVPEHLRGTYAGLAHPATIAHLRDLGVTTVELLPIHAGSPEPFLAERGLTNYWNYNTLAYFAPEPAYATRAAQAAGPAAVLDEVKGMVHLLHEAGLEVVLDVVYNHTCEGGAHGPSLSLRGLDNTSYYLHDGVAPAALVDVTGCGNSLDFRRTRVVQLVLDSLRFWAGEIGVDGFRFDLAVTSGRNGGEFSPDHPFLVALVTDPVLAGTKLIAEPWDMGPGGWRTGEFPAPMADWNDRFRDALRTFWLADPAAATHGRTGSDLRDLATRLAGSADLFSRSEVPGGRGPLASINFVTAHDGFTLADLVTYDRKHNEANTEDNRDGTDNNRSWNHGVEGPILAGSERMRIDTARRRSMRNLLGSLLLSAGTPMLTAGDELGRTQRGNNNGYCQDNEISWVDWDLTPWQRDLLATTRHLLRLRREHPVLRPTRFATGRTASGDSLADLAWFSADGEPMDAAAWHDPHARVLQMQRSGHPVGDRDALILINGSLGARTVRLAPGRGTTLTLAWDSAADAPPNPVDGGTPVYPGQAVNLEPLSMRLYLTRH
ncbi:glycogen debranching protein GlgX [Georgenia sp. MJ278]